MACSSPGGIDRREKCSPYKGKLTIPTISGPSRETKIVPVSGELRMECSAFD